MITIRGHEGVPLIKANVVDLWSNSNEIVAMANSRHWHTLGSYATRERCIEIVDEIQCEIRNAAVRKDDPMPFYQMPAEYEEAICRGISAINIANGGMK